MVLGMDELVRVSDLVAAFDVDLAVSSLSASGVLGEVHVEFFDRVFDVPSGGAHRFSRGPDGSFANVGVTDEKLAPSPRGVLVEVPSPMFMAAPLTEYGELPRALDALVVSPTWALASSAYVMHRVPLDAAGAFEDPRVRVPGPLVRAAIALLSDLSSFSVAPVGGRVFVRATSPSGVLCALVDQVEVVAIKDFGFAAPAIVSTVDVEPGALAVLAELPINLSFVPDADGVASLVTGCVESFAAVDAELFARGAAAFDAPMVSVAVGCMGTPLVLSDGTDRQVMVATLVHR